MAPTHQQKIKPTTAPCPPKPFISRWENVTSSKPAIVANLSRDYNRMNSTDRPPASQPESGPSNSSVATGVPNAELAALIPSIVDERMNRHCSNDQLARPSPPSNLQRHGPSPPLPPQDGGQNTPCQVPTSSLQSSPASNLLPNTAVPSGLTASSGLGPSPLLLTSLIQLKSRPSTRTSDSLPSQAT